jgi:2-dehydro-3-deoxyphosphooctonate aldolase (KDO 8-P synthase)
LILINTVGRFCDWLLSDIKSKYKIPVVTDFHEPWQAKHVSEVADILQIPAFLCRQTDMLLAAAKTGKTVNVKKGQFLAPWDMRNVVAKLESERCRDILLTERGVSFGYNNLIVDMTGITEMQKFGYPVIFDATHSVQKPGGNGDSTRGNREHAETLARAAVAAGADGLFMEVHPDPDKAKSDGPNMIKLCEAERILTQLADLYRLIGAWSI